MGLAINRLIVEARGGRLQVSTAVACGSVFHVIPPRAEGVADR
jgi:signal transduction histidine kinase